MAQDVMFSRLVRVRFWDLVGQGLLPEQAGDLVGVSRPTASLWFRKAGGVYPCLKPSRYRLDLSEREEIRAMLERGCGVREIARALGRAASTVSREIQRGQQRSGGGYKAVLAERRAQQRARRPKVGKLAGSPRLAQEVQSRLLLKHSPEQIAARLRVDFPGQEEMQVSHETIYKALYVQGRGGLRKELTACLRTGRAMRKPRGRAATEQRGRIPGMVSISERPAEVEDRAVPGHWEGDLILGAHCRSAIGTLVERTTGFVILLHLPDGHTAEHVQQAMTKMSQLPQILRRTLTWDQGREMANHVQITEAMNLDIYFCDPHSPWQRGSNENTNGLLRQYFPKGTDLSGYTEHYLDYVAAELNSRPRKRLNWQTPAEELDRLLSTPNPTVAFTA